jgi:hypothetical protein
MGRERGQAGIETLVALPLLLLVVLAGAQAAAWAAATVYGATAAGAGARALARGAPAGPAARAELPGPLRRRARVTTAGGEVRVVIRLPSLLPGVPALEVGERAAP